MNMITLCNIADYMGPLRTKDFTRTTRRSSMPSRRLYPGVLTATGPSTRLMISCATSIFYNPDDPHHMDRITANALPSGIKLGMLRVRHRLSRYRAMFPTAHG